jgi:hypothetical protein
MDREAIDQYNRSIRNGDNKVIVESIPEPFIGNPQTANVVLLSLNPGHSEDDAKAYSDSDFRKGMMHNLRHEAQECPFYGLNPKFAWTACGQCGGRTRADCTRRDCLGKPSQMGCCDRMVSVSFEEIGFAQQARVPLAVLFVPPSQRDAGEQDCCGYALEEALAGSRFASPTSSFSEESPEPPYQCREHGQGVV